MIKKLRRKFIILSTVSLLLLFAVIVVSSSLLTYRELVSNADLVLSFIAENDGKPPHILPPEHIFIDGGPKEAGHDILLKKRKISPEIMYEARFFTVNINNDGVITDTNTESIAMVDDDTAAEYARLVQNKKSDKGFLDNFRYMRIKGENDMSVIFLDRGRNLYTFKNTLYINCLISFAGLLVIFVIIVFYSKRIVKPVAESYEKQKQFISMAGHEIKTPITIIDADAEILSMEIGEDNEWLQDICTQTKKMAALTNDMLSLSRMDESRQQFNMIDFPISDVVGEVVQSFQALAISNDKNITTRITPYLSYTGDENGIRQIVGILLDNAIKYSVGADDIELILEKKNHGILLTVTNSSAQVEQEQLKHFFDRFYRTEQSGKSGKGGYGLGLAIAKAIVEAHKGKIAAASPRDNVVRITVMLP